MPVTNRVLHINYHPEIADPEERLWAVWGSFYGALCAYGSPIPNNIANQFIAEFKFVAGDDPLLKPYVRKFIGACSQHFGLYYDEHTEQVVRVNPHIDVENAKDVDLDQAIEIRYFAKLPPTNAGENENQILQGMLMRYGSLMYALPEDPLNQCNVCDLCEALIIAIQKDQRLRPFMKRVFGVLSFEMGIRMYSRRFAFYIDREQLSQFREIRHIDITQYPPAKCIASPSTPAPHTQILVPCRDTNIPKREPTIIYTPTGGDPRYKMRRGYI